MWPDEPLFIYLSILGNKKLAHYCLFILVNKIRYHLKEESHFLGLSTIYLF